LKQNTTFNDNTSTSDLVRRYRFLFTLPKSTSVLYIFCCSIYALTEFLYLNVNQPPNFSLWFELTVVLLAQLIVIELSNWLLSRRSRIINRRRISSTFIFSNLIWLISSILVLTNQNNRIISATYFVFSLFVLISMDVFLIWPLYTEGFLPAIGISLMHVTILPVIAWSPLDLRSIPLHQLSLSIGFGLLSIIIMTFTLYYINQKAYNVLHNSAFNLLKAFMNSWMNSDSEMLESLLDDHAFDAITTTRLVHIETKSGKRLALVIPNLHPGPFYPVGSYNLTQQLQAHFSSLGYTDCFVLHGPVDHAFNIPSKKEVSAYLSQLKLDNADREMDNIISLPKSTKFNKGEMISFSLGKHKLFFLSAWPEGSEDYPPKFIEGITRLERKHNQNIIVIDSHNTIGIPPDSQEIEGILNKIEEFLTDSVDEQKYELKASFTSMEKLDGVMKGDVGAGSIGITIFAIAGKSYALIIADSNNAKAEVRPTIERELKTYGINLLDLTTSDTHFNAAQIRNRRGYLVLGEKTNIEKLAKAIAERSNEILAQVEPSNAKIISWNTKVRISSFEIFEKLRASISESIRNLKLGILIYSLVVAVGAILIL
jgi:putative membrane protein